MEQILAERMEALEKVKGKIASVREDSQYSGWLQQPPPRTRKKFRKKKARAPPPYSTPVLKSF